MTEAVSDTYMKLLGLGLDEEGLPVILGGPWCGEYFVYGGAADCSLEVLSPPSWKGIIDHARFRYEFRLSVHAEAGMFTLYGNEAAARKAFDELVFVAEEVTP